MLISGRDGLHHLLPKFPKFLDDRIESIQNSIMSVRPSDRLSHVLSTVFITGEITRGNKNKIGPKSIRPCIINQKSEIQIALDDFESEGIWISDF